MERAAGTGAPGRFLAALHRNLAKLSKPGGGLRYGPGRALFLPSLAINLATLSRGEIGERGGENALFGHAVVIMKQSVTRKGP